MLANDVSLIFHKIFLLISLLWEKKLSQKPSSAFFAMVVGFMSGKGKEINWNNSYPGSNWVS